MWSSGFSITLDIEPAAGICLPALAGAFSGAALVATVSSGLAPGWLAGLLTLAMLEVLRLVRRYGPRGSHRVVRLRLSPDGPCRVSLGSGEQGPVRLRCGWVWPDVAVGIALERVGDDARRPVLLFRDQMDDCSWRRLLVFCRQANPPGMT